MNGRSRLLGVAMVLAAMCLLVPFGVSCRSTDPGETADEVRIDPGWPKGNDPWQPVAYVGQSAPLPTISGAEYVREDGLCKVCHSAHASAFQDNVHRQHSCETCHGPASRHLETRGREPGTILSFRQLNPVQRSEICAQCHEEDACSPGNVWRTSAHASNGVSCTNCHTAHYDVPPGTPALVGSLAQASGEQWHSFLASYREQAPDQDGSATATQPSLRGTSNNLGAVAPRVCYQCHAETRELERIAHPHQILGQHGFNCTTCHNSHGNVIEHSRKDLCLTCHDQSSPTLAWHSSSHNIAGVACTDCHNPHPSSSVQPVVHISHTHVARPERLPMAVNDPQACYKCHTEEFAKSQMPSHHPIMEGKLVCSDCHDPHGQSERNLKGDSLNALCYRCHAEKQGPFVYEHPPVTQDCSICHEPHGTVTNNLLHQPATFLCLRCHTGHRTLPGNHPAFPVANIDNDPAQRPQFYTDCTQCHEQVHGSDFPSQRSPHALLR